MKNCRWYKHHYGSDLKNISNSWINRIILDQIELPSSENVGDHLIGWWPCWHHSKLKPVNDLWVICTTNNWVWIGIKRARRRNAVRGMKDKAIFNHTLNQIKDISLNCAWVLSSSLLIGGRNGQTHVWNLCLVHSQISSSKGTFLLKQKEKTWPTIWIWNLRGSSRHSS